MTTVTYEMEKAYNDIASQVTGRLEVCSISALQAVLEIADRGRQIPGEPIWDGHQAKQVRIELESILGVDVFDAGIADRPSEVVRRLRNAADDIEQRYINNFVGGY